MPTAKQRRKARANSYNGSVPRKRNRKAMASVTKTADESGKPSTKNPKIGGGAGGGGGEIGVPGRKGKSKANIKQRSLVEPKLPEPNDDLDWQSWDPGMDERNGWSMFLFNHLVCVCMSTSILTCRRDFLLSLPAEGGFVGCEVLSGKDYVVETSSGATKIRKKPKKKKLKKDDKDQKSKSPSADRSATSTTTIKSRKNEKHEDGVKNGGGGGDDDTEAETPPQHFHDAPDAVVQTTGQEPGSDLGWEKVTPTMDERTGWGKLRPTALCALCGFDLTSFASGAHLNEHMCFVFMLRGYVVAVVTTTEEGGFVGCEVLSGKFHEVEVLPSGAVRIVAKSTESLKANKARVKANFATGTPHVQSDKSAKTKKKKEKKVKDKAEKKPKRVIDQRIQSAVQAALEGQKKDGSKPLQYKQLRDKIAKQLGRELDTAERQHIAEAIKPKAPPMTKEEKKKAKKAKRLAARKEKERARKKANQDRAAIAAAEARAAHHSIPVEDLSPAWTQLVLHNTILENVARLGFVRPTPIQSMCVPNLKILLCSIFQSLNGVPACLRHAILICSSWSLYFLFRCIPAAVRDRRDVVGAAQTGSGKTLAFGIPMVQALLALLEEKGMATMKTTGSKRKAPASERNGGGGGNQTEKPSVGLFGLVVSPTRELSMQIKAHIQELLVGTSASVVAIVGGMAKPKQQRLLSRKPAIVVGTPGRLWDLFASREPHFRNMHSTLRFFVLDEFDRMVRAIIWCAVKKMEKRK